MTVPEQTYFDWCWRWNRDPEETASMVDYEQDMFESLRFTPTFEEWLKGG